MSKPFRLAVSSMLITRPEEGTLVAIREAGRFEPGDEIIVSPITDYGTLQGLIRDIDPIVELAAKHGLILYEDACQAVFSRYKGRLAGTFGKSAAFSFDAEKTMGSDTGGCVITNDDELADRLRFVGLSRGAVMEPHFGRKHAVAGYASRR